jgi:hypothetical protein
MFGDFFTQGKPFHELTYVPLYHEPAPIPPIYERVIVTWKGGTAQVPTLASLMRQRVTALLGYTSGTLSSSRSYYAIQTGWKDGEGGGLFPRPEDLEREMIPEAKQVREYFGLDWTDAEITERAKDERKRLEVWLFDALNFLHQERDRGAIELMSTTPPPPPGYVKTPVTSGPGAMGLPE